MRISKSAKLAAVALTAVAALAAGAVVANADDVSEIAGGATEGTEADRAAFAELRERQEQAWIDEDGAAFAATFHEDADVVTFNGDHLATRDGIAEGMQYYFDNFIEGSRLNMLTEQIRYVERDVVVIVRTGCLLDEGETECREDSFSTNTNVITREGGEWLQTSFQNTRQFGL